MHTIYIYICVWKHINKLDKFIYIYICHYIYIPNESVINKCVCFTVPQPGDFLHLPQRYGDGRAHPKWLAARKNRLTASRFACACAARGARKNRKAAVLDAWWVECMWDPQPPKKKLRRSLKLSLLLFGSIWDKLWWFMMATKWLTLGELFGC
jgi:hypothetical protein